MSRVEAGRPNRTTDNFSFSPPFLRAPETASLPMFEATESFKSAGPVLREYLKKDILHTLKAPDMNPFMTGQNFSAYTETMAEIIGGVRTVDTKQTLAALKDPFENVSKITFLRKDEEGFPEGYAKIMIDTKGTTPERIEYSFGDHEMGESFTGLQVQINRKPLQDKGVDSLKGQDISNHNEKLDLSMSVRDTLKQIYKTYATDTEKDDLTLDERSRNIISEQDVFTLASEQPVDIFVNNPRLVGNKR